MLYVTYDGITDPLGQSQILPYLIGLTRAGHSFTICSMEKKEVYKKNENYVRKLLLPYSIEWKPIPYCNKKGIWSKIHSQINFKTHVKKIFSSASFQLIHCRSYPASIIGMNLSEKFNVPFVFDMRGFWADERVEGKIWKLSNPIYNQLYKWFKRKEKQLLKNSNAIISLTQNAKNEILNWNLKNVSNQKITVIPCCVDVTHFTIANESSRTNYCDELSIPTDKKILLYSGSTGTWYMTNEMFDFYIQFKNNFKNTLFLMVTTQNHEALFQLANKKGINTNEIKIVSATREQMPKYIQCAHAALNFILPSYSKKASSPVKLAEYMACGIPVFCNKNIGDIDLHATFTTSILLLDEMLPNSYMKSILDFEQMKNNTSATREFVLNNYSLKNGIELYSAVYRKIGN